MLRYLPLIFRYLPPAVGFILLLLSAFQCAGPGQVLLDAGATGWRSSGNAEWQFGNGGATATVAAGEEGYLITEATYADFELRVDFRADSTINSGIFVRCPAGEMSPTACLEVNIWDLHPRQEFRTGAIVLRAPPRRVLHTLGRWNEYRIHCRGDRTRIYLNGRQTVDYRSEEPRRGHIGLQASGNGTVSFRNLRLRAL